MSDELKNIYNEWMMDEWLMDNELMANELSIMKMPREGIFDVWIMQWRWLKGERT